MTEQPQRDSERKIWYWHQRQFSPRASYTSVALSAVLSLSPSHSPDLFFQHVLSWLLWSVLSSAPTISRRWCLIVSLRPDASLFLQGPACCCYRPRRGTRAIPHAARFHPSRLDFIETFQFFTVFSSRSLWEIPIVFATHPYICHPTQNAQRWIDWLAIDQQSLSKHPQLDRIFSGILPETFSALFTCLFLFTGR